MTLMDQEPRVTRVDPAAADPSLRESFDGFIRLRGKVPNLFRISAHNPPVGRTLSAHLDAVMGPGTVSELLKELCAVRVSQLNGCDY
jgi:alkylhydroperoxidase family enzyme